MNKCPGCAEVELDENILYNERACWLCLETGYVPTTLSVRPNRSDVNTLPYGWTRSDVTLEYIGPQGQRISAAEVHNAFRKPEPPQNRLIKW